VEEGLRRVLDDAAAPAHYELPDCAVGKQGTPNPLENLSLARPPRRDLRRSFSTASRR
jgi:hypothetical protein